MTLVTGRWLGRDEHGGVPSQARHDCVVAPSWRLDAIFATERPHHLAVSPDGSKVAFVLSSNGESDIYVVEVTGGQALRLTTDRSLASYWEDSGPQWSPDGSALAYTSGDQTCVVDAEGGPPLRIPGVSLGTWFDNDRLVVVVERKRSTRTAIVDITDPWPLPFGPAGGDVSALSRVGDGRIIGVFWPRDDFSRSDVFIAEPDGEWATISGGEGRRALSPCVHDQNLAYVREDGDWRAVYLTDLACSEHHLLAKDDADFGDLAWAADGKTLVATRTARGKADLMTITADGSVEMVAEGGFWQSPQWAGSTIVAVHESHDTAPRLVAVRGEDTLSLYDGAPVSVSAAAHADFERIVFRSSDGLEIEGFLFRPSDVLAPVPAVVYPHGGPTSVYGDEWDGHAQYFVDKGYGWLAINFRGSTTYGLGFERANHNDWGRGDTEDCIAAGRYLQGLDWVDANRLAIFGASYGSYMSLAALVHPDNPFVCGVAKYGDCNILTSWAQGDRAGVDDLERMMGHPSTNRSAYHAGSPIHVIERIDRPILIAHGEKDARVHLKQAEELVVALEQLGKTYEYVTYPLEAHGFLRRDSQIDFYKRLERFLDWYLM